MKTKARILAFYLPQFHPTEINDTYWGKGFTEWTNVAKAKPLYRGHYQPQIPADLGFYDLRLPEVRQAQADMARACGVEGFVYWNYWFGRGKKILEMPIEEIMRLHEPDFPFCIGWGNHDWSNKTWQKSGRFQQDVVFLKQEYLGKEDYADYFRYLLPMFLDKRYIRVDNKPLFYIFAPENVPDLDVFRDTWNTLAKENGLEGIFIVGRVDSLGKVNLVNEADYKNRSGRIFDEAKKRGLDGISSSSFRRSDLLADGFARKAWKKLRGKLFGYSLNDHDYLKFTQNYYIPEDRREDVFPMLTPRKDKTPRAGKNAMIYRDSTPEKFRLACQLAWETVKDKPYDRRILFLNSWNEWGEGSYMEPDIVFGHQYLDVLREEFEESQLEECWRR